MMQGWRAQRGKSYTIGCIQTQRIPDQRRYFSLSLQSAQTFNRIPGSAAFFTPSTNTYLETSVDPRIENTSRLRRWRCIHLDQCGRRTCPAPDGAGSHHSLTSHPPMYSHSDMGQVPVLLHRAHRPTHGTKSSAPSHQSRSDTFWTWPHGGIVTFDFEQVPGDLVERFSPRYNVQAWVGPSRGSGLEESQNDAELPCSMPHTQASR